MTASATVPPSTEHTESIAEDPWERFGWVMGAIWLVFLGFPIAAIITSDRPGALRALGVVLIVGFAAIYVRGLVRSSRVERRFVRAGWLNVVTLSILMVATIVLVGTEGIGMMPFVVAMAVFVLPLRAALAVFGAAIVATGVGAWTVGRPFTADGGAWFLLLIVALVGAVCLVVRVLEQRGAEHRVLTDHLALTTERERVARDVHDVLGHSLTVVTVKAELAERLVDTDPERAKAELAQIRDLTRQSLAEIRATVGGLRVARLTDQISSAHDALDDTGISSELIGDPSAVDPRHRVVLAWSLREAVTNVVRHSGASTCRIELGSDFLTVDDDGHGVRGRREGNGLRGLRERVGAAGGTVDVGPGADGQGTRLKVQL
ncbi:sensor histidine kinase [Aeromicrobium sp.]|uniref:sensor histidine kinase n=1 Tax=Aeromicrobium sp. TaxID=1871063 RepID=UPI003D6A4D2E